MMKLARVGVRMLGFAAVLAIGASFAGHPWWMMILPRLLLAGGIINLVVAGTFEWRREARYRAECRLARAEEALWGPFAIGTCPDHGVIWATQGHGTFQAYASHGACMLRAYERAGAGERIRALAAIAEQLEAEQAGYRR